MDGTRFDAVTKLMGTGAPRRSVLKGILGLFAGASAAAPLLVSAQVGGCLDDQECGPGFICCGGYSINSCRETECCGVGDAEHCAAGTVCSGTFLTCIAPCGNSNDACETTADCCDPLAVCQNALCVITCLAPGQTCTTDGDCCAGTCCDGACANIECCPSAEKPDASCPAGATCNDGFCEQLCVGAALGDACSGEVACCVGLCCDGTCVDAVCCSDADCGADEVCSEGSCACSLTAEGETCEADEECCSGVCCGGTCQSVQCCMEDEDPNARCSEGATCVDGICDGGAEEGGEIPVLSPSTGEKPNTANTTTLPNAGIGVIEEPGSGVLGLGLAAGAAALIAARKLRQPEEPTAG
jgi:hypothetical protein